jgi:hypothetical protein
LINTIALDYHAALTCLLLARREVRNQLLAEAYALRVNVVALNREGLVDFAVRRRDLTRRVYLGLRGRDIMNRTLILDDGAAMWDLRHKRLEKVS